MELLSLDRFLPRRLRRLPGAVVALTDLPLIGAETKFEKYPTDILGYILD